MMLAAIIEGLPLDDLPLFKNALTASEVDISGCEIVQALVVALAPARQHRPTTLIARLQATAPVADPTKRRQFLSLDPARSVLWPSMSALGHERSWRRESGLKRQSKKAPDIGAFLLARLMHFHSGLPLQNLSGVDTV